MAWSMLAAVLSLAPTASPIVFEDRDVVDEDVHPLEKAADNIAAVYQSRSPKEGDEALTLAIVKRSAKLSGKYKATKAGKEAAEVWHPLRGVTLAKDGGVTIALDPKRPWMGAAALKGRAVSIDNNAEVYHGLLVDAPDKRRFFLMQTRLLGRAQFSASSKLDDKHGPDLVDDSDTDTAWAPKKGASAGEWIEITFDRPTSIGSMMIANGNQKSEALFEANNRLKKIAVTFDGQDKQLLEIRDGKGELQFSLAKRMTATKVRVEILEVYKGTKGEETYVSELYFVP